LRDCAEGSTSGRAAIKITDPRQARYWAELHEEVVEFMASDYLPGRIWACCLLFGRNELLQYVCAERLRYFMGHLVLSGISGNICLGRLVNAPLIKDVAERTVRTIAAATGEPLEGLLTVDLREDRTGRPLVTEINLRHIAITSAFAQAGVNLVEAQILAAQGRWAQIDRRTPSFPPDNALLRDIDGLPVWVPQRRHLAVGEHVDRNGGME
jgi:carbamoyl-phosphate synthase large subunit